MEKHDPTTLNRQGQMLELNIVQLFFTLTKSKKILAEESLDKLQQNLTNKIVTEITEADTFWKAEEYHQKILLKNIT